MLRCGLKPIIIVLNNGGYTIERILSDNPDDKFNDIMQMNYSKFARVFEGNIWSTRVETEDDFDKALKVTQIMNKLCYIEIVTEPDDMPELTKKLIKSFKSSNDETTTIPEVHSMPKSELKISKSILNFATQVHESLKG